MNLKLTRKCGNVLAWNLSHPGGSNANGVGWYSGEQSIWIIFFTIRSTGLTNN